MADFENDKLYYRDNPSLRREGIKNWEFEDWQEEEFAKCIVDPIYFIRNYVKIINVDEGLVLFDMHDYQEEMVNAFHNNRFSIVRIGRQSGKTTTTVGYLLWLTLFSENFSIAITANKKSLATEILSRYQLAYENLPMWIQQGVKIWNKGSIELENGCKILAASTAASSIRGGSFNLVFMDEFAHVHNNLAEDFFTSTYPVISSGKTTKIIIVSTPRGMNLYYRMWMDAINGKSDYFPVDIHWSRVPGRDDAWKEMTIRNTSLRQFNQEFECNFLGSTNTLIDGTKLATLVAIDPLDTDTEQFNGMTIPSEMDVFIPPIKESFDPETKKQIDKDHIYAMTVDVSEGKNLDYSAFSIFDVSTIPYQQVAVYRNNQLHPMLFPDIIKLCAEYYNNAYVLIETNNNPTVADTLYQDLEYENVLKVFAGNKKAQQISESGKATQNGVNMSPLVKRVGCTTLKTLIETDKLRLNSDDTIYELTRFIATNNSFAAEEGANDDLAMTLVIFAWLTTQKLFIELSSTDIRKRLQIENNYAKEEDIEAPPMPQFYNPLMEKYTLEDGDLWEVVNPVEFYY